MVQIICLVHDDDDDILAALLDCLLFCWFVFGWWFYEFV